MAALLCSRGAGGSGSGEGQDPHPFTAFVRHHQRSAPFTHGPGLVKEWSRHERLSCRDSRY